MQNHKEMLTVYPKKGQTWREHGDVACDAADAVHLPLKLTGGLVGDNASWVDTSLAATEKANFSCLCSALESPPIEASDIQPMRSSVSETQEEQSETELQWLDDLVMDLPALPRAKHWVLDDAGRDFVVGHATECQPEQKKWSSRTKPECRGNKRSAPPCGHCTMNGASALVLS